jgi:hypothetical protein
VRGRSGGRDDGGKRGKTSFPGFFEMFFFPFFERKKTVREREKPFFGAGDKVRERILLFLLSGSTRRREPEAGVEARV